MKQYLLDTCICVFLFRQKFGIEKKFSQVDASQCFVSEITLAELKFGAYKSNRVEENLNLIDQFISQVNIVPFAESVDFYAQEKVRLCSLGTPVEDFDLLIASAASVRGLVLVTDNLKHFRNINGLVVENWVER